MTDQRPWLTNYPKGVPANIDAESYTSMAEMIEEAFEKYAKLPAFTCMGKTLSFEQIDKYSKQFGAYLRSRGLEKGDKVGIMMPNLLQYPICLFGALRAGLIVVNTNPLYTPREMLHQFTDAGVKAVVIAENFAANLQKILGDTNIKTVVVTSIGELLGGIKGPLVNFVVRSIKRMVPKYDIPNTVTFSEALKQGKKFTLEKVHGQPDDVILLQYTGGTTGVAKGAMLTNKNMIANMLQIKANFEPFCEATKEVALAALPFYHIFALTVNAMAMLHLGNHNILVTNPRDQKSLLKLFKKYPVSLFPGVNTLFNALLNNPKFTSLDFSPMKVVVAGGMALQRPVAERWHKTTGCSISEGYGLTETSPVVTVNPIDGSGKIGSIGLPVPSTHVRIVDAQGMVLGPLQEGEIQVKGPQVMKGYYNRPGETAKVLSADGWLSTGDIGIMHEDGYFQIVDRKKDMINVSGFNVYPNEIEDVIAGHPKVLEVAAIGVPHEKSGEAVKVFIVKKEKSLTEKEIIDFSRENLTGYKVPKLIEFRDSLPKTNVGKILRRALREEAVKSK